jgi:hypothetical protein
MTITMMKQLLPTFCNFSTALTLSMLLLAGTGCSAKSPDSHDDAAKGPSGTLKYQGIVSGSVTFQSADCAFDGHQHLLVFQAPHQDKYHPEVKTPGPFLNIGMVDPGAMVHFTSDVEHVTAQNDFMVMRQQGGVTFAKKGDAWVVTINGLQMPNQDLMNQKTVTLSGTFICTHLVNH